MHLYMIRHGQSFVNLDNWENGNLDEGLTELGQRQAAALARWLVTEIPQVDVLYASDMRRAKETAAPLAEAYRLAVQYDERLREIGNNRLDHTAWPNDALPEYGDYWSSERPFSPVTPLTPDGETFMHFRVRVGIAIEEWVANHQDQVVVAVCHGGVVEAAFDHIFNIGPWRRCEVWNRNTGVTYFEYVNHPLRETWRLHYHNAVIHFEDL
jgi:broad specificity phosphatase PhoE